MYLDPAFGGMLLQVSIAIIAVGGGIIYSLRRKIKSFFAEGKKNKANKKLVKGEVVDVLDDKSEGN